MKRKTSLLIFVLCAMLCGLGSSDSQAHPLDCAQVLALAEVSLEADVAESMVAKKIRFLKLLTNGVPTDVEFFIQHTNDLFFRKAGAQGLPVSRRGVLRYLWNLQLLNYNFAHKKILDVAAGKSKFTTIINKVYGETGTRAFALDCSAQRSLDQHDLYVNGDAYNLPFDDETFNLTVSSWFLNNLWKSDLAEVNGFMTGALKRSVNEMVRVTKPGGEVRFIQTWLDGWSSKAMRAYLKDNPRVFKIVATPPGLFNGMIRIIVK